MTVDLCELLLIFIYIVTARGEDCIIPGNKTSMVQYNGNVSHGMNGDKCERMVPSDDGVREHNLCRYDGKGTELDGPWCYTRRKSHDASIIREKCDVPICGSLDISNATTTASSRMKNNFLGYMKRLTDGVARSHFSTDCRAPIETRKIEWVIIKMEEISSVRFVALTPRQEPGYAVRASNISIFVKEGKNWTKCADSGVMSLTIKMFRCEARTQEVKLERKPIDKNKVRNGECMELAEVHVIKNPNGWSDWSSWSERSEKCASRTRICEKPGYGGEPCGLLNVKETEAGNCATTLAPTKSNQILKIEYYMKKGAPYAIAFVGVLILANILALYCAWKPMDINKDFSTSSSDIFFAASTPSSELEWLSSSITNISTIS